MNATTRKAHGVPKIARDYRPLVKRALREGWTQSHTRSAVLLTAPSGRVFTLRSVLDGSTLRAFRQELGGSR